MVVGQEIGGQGAMSNDNDGDEQLMMDDEEDKNQMEHDSQPERDGEQAMDIGQGSASILNRQHLTASQELCKLCYENECDAAFVPCGHMTACIKCASRCD